eukprot:TRINITY_DN397_c0_g3_i1.p1 TRINITY_DN397_c0_g3~~TRINITY_DN397_c0_g3_i1.p1  ORF type:complete len:384 (+),score=74.35 TRINITY_DN397_c0_g3_i1:228-1379(+)
MSPVRVRAVVTGGSGFLGREVLAALGGVSRSSLLKKLAEEVLGCSTGAQVFALSRSERADAAIKTAYYGNDADNSKHLEIVRGDMASTEAMTACFQVTEGKSDESDDDVEELAVVFHAAAKVDLSGTLAEHRSIGLRGTELLLDAADRWVAVCPASRRVRFVYVSSEQAILGGPTLVQADETWPYPSEALGPYSQTKAETEKMLLKRYGDGESGDGSGGVSVMMVRPRMIWGAGDTVLLKAVVDKVRAGKFAWLAGGEAVTSTSEVRNVVEGLLCAALRGRHRQVYFVTDSVNHSVKSFLSDQLNAVGVPGAESSPSLPMFAAKFLAYFTLFGMEGPLPRLIGEECTVVDKKARDQIGYTSHVSYEEGLKDLHATADAYAQSG